MLKRAILIVIMAFASAHVAYAASTGDARQFVDAMGKQVLSIVNTPGGNEDQKQKQLQQLFVQNVDIEWMGQFVLGRAWQSASADQRSRYLDAYRNYLLARYTTDFADYSGSKYKITDVHADEDGQFSVNMEINATNNNQNVLAGYRLHSSGTQFKIFDIIIEGVSLITTERSEFSAAAQHGGMDALISDLQSKAQTEKRKS